MSEDLRPMTAVRIATSQDLESIERCRFEVYSQEGYIDPCNYPDGREWDVFDGHSTSVVATNSSELYAVGTARLILNHENKLPCQDPDHHNVDTSEMGVVAEISRLAVRREWRRPGGIQVGLYRVLYHLAIKNGIENLLAVVDEKFFKTLTWIGFPFSPIGPLREYMGTTLPCVCRVDDIMPSLQDSEPANLIGVTTMFEQPFTGTILVN